MRTTASLLILGVATSLGSFPAATATSGPEARGGVIFNAVRYDPAGRDTGSNSHVNREVVQITNNTNKRRSLKGWTLRDEGSIHVYRFPRTRLRPNRTVTVHTGKGRDHGLQRYWDQGFYVWNNDGDVATLRNRSGRTIDRCSWDDGDGTTRC